MFEFNEKFRLSSRSSLAVFGPFEVAVKLDGQGQPEALTPRSTEQGQQGTVVHRFGNDADTVRAELRLSIADNGTLLASVSAETVNDNDFGKQRAFAAEHAIIVKIRPQERIEGLMANYQHKDWWTRPHFDTDPARLPERTQSVVWRTAGGFYHLLPVVGAVWRTDAAGTEDGFALRLSAYESGRRKCETLAFAISAGDEPYRLVQSNVDAALKALDYPTLPRESKTYPELLDRLGWCSWDAFYHKVDEAGLLAKAEELQKLGLPVGWVMIDDGWSEVKDGKLVAFEADPVKFPGGLKRTVSALKERYGIRHVGVWHTIAGYWGGIHEDSTIARDSRDSLYQVPRGNLVPYPDAGRGFGFWHAWHGFLRRQGIDFVKVDSQSAVLNYLKERRSIGEAAAAAHEALEASVALHFNDTIINCMGMASENVWHRPKSAVSRNSDDFVPQEKRGFPEHALQNGYNSYYHGAFYWGDWDMYWSSNHDDKQNAVLRSVSGGPIYISDAPGNTNPANVWPLIYSDGTIIRCDGTANPTPDCLLTDPDKQPVPLKLWNTAGGAGVVAAFHIHPEAAPVDGFISPDDVPGLEGEEFAVYEHFTQSCSFMKAGQREAIRLDESGYALFAVVPVAGGVTPIGLADKYLSPASVADCFAEGDSTVVTLREGGRFVFASKGHPMRAIVNGEAAAVKQINDYVYEIDGGSSDRPARIEIVMA
ncbi:Raffinose synthase or seed imbibition protein Sip1 [Paenibacillus catalpae]|uniref:Raffinose synthase or seed imbibition protein Sip1 n=1 Tax=Paenibacillus catalpae TaxID=1045775 RepID=A0A1I1YI05_9BACL|nr:Sip1-related alpha-galactosidase [Paenibacillus catalpae]SFE19166.1 Raffinose synthase or seed imbibition protein Sip1 [Paenibacillus catalpae]